MALVRLYPPADGLHPTLAIPGTSRSYTCAAGSTIDAPDFDALILTHNGWTEASGGGVTLGTVGATTVRPTSPVKGQSFHDTTLGFVIVFDGKVWRRPDTGGAA